MAAYRIKDWNKVFYLARAYEAGEVSWVRFPVDRKGAAYIHLMTTREGRDAYIVFVAMVRLVARAKSTGTIDVPNYVIAAEACVPEKIVKRSIDILLAKPVQWLETGRAADSEKPPEIRNADAEKPRRGFQNALQEEEEEKDTTTSGFTTTSDGTPETGGGGDEAQEHRKKALAKVLNRPWWLGESKRWIDSEATANEIVTLLWSLPNNGGTKLWNETLAKAEKDAGLKSPAAFVISTIRAACGFKAGGGA